MLVGGDANARHQLVSDVFPPTPHAADELKSFGSAKMSSADPKNQQQSSTVDDDDEPDDWYVQPTYSLGQRLM